MYSLMKEDNVPGERCVCFKNLSTVKSFVTEKYLALTLGERLRMKVCHIDHLKPLLNAFTVPTLSDTLCLNIFI